MYARVLRKWSLHKYLMSHLWLAVVAMLLLIICAPSATTSMHLPTSITTTKLTTVIDLPPSITTNTRIPPQMAATSRMGTRNSRIEANGDAASITTIINSAANEEDNTSGIRKGGSGSSSISGSSSSSSSSNSKIFSKSVRLSRSSKQQQDHYSAESIVFSAYNKNEDDDDDDVPAVFGDLRNQQSGQEFVPPSSLSIDMVVETEKSMEEDEDSDHDETEDVAATYYKLNNVNNQNNVPNVPNSNSQIINYNNLYNTHNNLNQPQILNNINNNNPNKSNLESSLKTINANSLTSSAYNLNRNNNLSIRSNKLRRHIQPNALQQHSPPISASTSATSASIPVPLKDYHSPVREVLVAASQSGSGTSNSRSSSSSSLDKHPKAVTPPLAGPVGLVPFRFILESYEIPATLPFGEFTEQQRRLLLRQQQMQRMRMLEAATARNRRDSRDGALDTASGGTTYHYLQQQQQQQQQYHHNHHSTGLSSANTNNINNNSNNINNNNNNINNNNNNIHLHQHQRKRPRRYCSARDPAQLAFEAPTVFEGKIISMTPDRRANFSATVEVKDIFKQQIGYRMQNYLRLQFAYRNSSGECDIYRETLRPRGLVRGDELEQGRVYLMFVQQIDLRNYTILGQPIRKTRRVIEAVKNAVSENYAQLASIRSITASNRTVENGKELRIVCKVQGRPPPKVTWFKDHKSINRNRKLYQFVHYKKRSELIIKSFNSSDAGRYECRAKNKVNRNLERRAILIKAYPVPRYDVPTQQSGGKCPEDAYEFCFNGGTCKFFTEIGSYSCICPEGFIGERCERKEVNNMPPKRPKEKLKKLFNHKRRGPTYKTGYIADDPNVFDVVSSTLELPDIASSEDDEDDGDDGGYSAGDNEEDDFTFPPTKDPYCSKCY